MANAPLRACPVCTTKVDEASLGLRDFRWVSEAMPGKEAPMDIDCVVEKSGRVLMMEMKPKGASVPFGQMLTLRTFVRLGVDVWVVWEEPEGTFVTVGEMTRSGAVPFKERMNIAKLKNRVLEWRQDVIDAVNDVS